MAVMLHQFLRRGAVRFLFLAGALLLPACAKHAPNRYSMPACPLPPEARRYPVSVRSSDEATEESVLATIARATLSLWQHTLDDLKLDELQQIGDLLPLIPRLDVFDPGRWKPMPEDTATVFISYRRGSLGGPWLGVRKPNEFQRLALKSVTTAIRVSQLHIVAHDSMPLHIATARNTDSVLVTLRFGAEPQPGEGVARFALSRQSVRQLSMYRGHYPDVARMDNMEGTVKLAYIVKADSLADSSSIRVLSSTHPVFENVVRRDLRRIRYSPAVLDCRRIPQIVTQEFRFRLRR